MKHLIKFSTLTALLATAAAPGNALADCGSLGYKFDGLTCNDANNRLVCPEDPNKYFCKAVCPSPYQTTPCGSNATQTPHGTIPNCWWCVKEDPCKPAIGKWYAASSSYDRGVVLDAWENGSDCQITLLRVQETGLPSRGDISTSLSDFSPCEDNWDIYIGETEPTVTDPHNVNIWDFYMNANPPSPHQMNFNPNYNITWSCNPQDAQGGSIEIWGEFLWDANSAYYTPRLVGSTEGQICGYFKCECKSGDQAKPFCDTRCTSVGTTFLTCGSINNMYTDTKGVSCSASRAMPPEDRNINRALCTKLIEIPRTTLESKTK